MTYAFYGAYLIVMPLLVRILAAWIGRVTVSYGRAFLIAFAWAVCSSALWLGFQILAVRLYDHDPSRWGVEWTLMRYLARLASVLAQAAIAYGLLRDDEGAPIHFVRALAIAGISVATWWGIGRLAFYAIWTLGM